MAVTISGLRIKALTLDSNSEGGLDIKGSYELVGSTGKVLAKQSFGDYGGMDYKSSPAVTKGFETAVAGLAAELKTILGLED